MSYINYINYRYFNSAESKLTYDLCSDGKLSDIVVLNPELTPNEWLECACIADKNSHVAIVEYILEHRLDDFDLVSLFGQACSQGLNIIRDVCLRDHLGRLKSMVDIYEVVSLTFCCCLVNEYFDTCDLLLKQLGEHVYINLYLAHNTNDFKSSYAICKFLITRGATDHSVITKEVVYELLCNGIDVNNTNTHACRIKHERRIRGLAIKKQLIALQNTEAPMCDADNISTIMADYVAHEQLDNV